MPLNQKLTDKPQKTTLTSAALIHVVEPNDSSQGSDGSDYKVLVDDLLPQAGQDNIDIRKNVNILFTDTYTQILAKINALANYTVNEKQSVWFICRQVTSGAGQLPRVIKYKMMLLGKGNYGTGGTQLTFDNIENIYDNTASLLDIENNPTTDKILYGDLVGETISEWLNVQDPAIVIQPQEDGYTLFEGSIDGVDTTYLWIGLGGVYGLGDTQSTMADFQVISDDISSGNVDYGWATPQQYGAVGDGIADDTLAVQQCQLENDNVFWFGEYLVTDTIDFREAQSVFSNNAKIKMSGTTGTILSASSVSNWGIGGLLTIEGGGNVSGTQKGMYIYDAQNFKIDNITFLNIAGDPIEFDDITPTGRGNRGLVYNLSAKDNYGSVLFSDRAEYHTVQNINIQGSSTVALKILSGNVSVIGGSVADNVNGIYLGGTFGNNNSHGILANVNFNHNDLSGGYNGKFENVEHGQTIIGCHFYGGARNIEIVESKGLCFTGCIIDGEIENIDSTPANNWTHMFNGCQINTGTSVVGVTQNLIFRDCFTMTGIYSNTPDSTVIHTNGDETKTGMLTLVGAGPGTLNITRNGVGTLFANSSTDDGYLAYNLGGTTLFYRVFGNGNITIGQAAGTDTGERLQVNGEVKVGTAVASTSAMQKGQVDALDADNVKLSGASQTISGDLTVNDLISDNDVTIINGNVIVQGLGNGIMLKSPDGTDYQLTVSNAGALVITAI